MLFTLSAWCAWGQSEHTYQFETIDDNEIAWSCTGEGNPTILLIAGMGLAAHPSFDRIFHGYQGPGRICMYDRAGLGESTFSRPRLRTLDELVEELYALSSRKGWRPAILVPHSFGGFIARAYAAAYPDYVSGIVFLDVAHEDWLPSMKSEMTQSDWTVMERIIAWNGREFHEDYVEGQEAMLGIRLPKHLPITIVTRGVPHTQIRLERLSYAGVDIYERTHQELQYDLMNLTEDAQHRYARVASHMINQFDPWLVLEEIEKMVDRLDR